MTLQSSGQISFSQLNTELGRSSTASIALKSAEIGTYGAINTNSTSRPNGSAPYAISEWYSYNHSAAPAYTSPLATSGLILDLRSSICFCCSFTASISKATSFSYLTAFIPDSRVVTISGSIASIS